MLHRYKSRKIFTQMHTNGTHTVSEKRSQQPITWLVLINKPKQINRQCRKLILDIDMAQKNQI